MVEVNIFDPDCFPTSTLGSDAILIIAGVMDETLIQDPDVLYNFASNDHARE